MASAKWDDGSHRIFVELCVEEVTKGNKPNTTLSSLGWQNVHDGFKRKTKKDYTIKQLKNHWNMMKGEHQLFKQLKRGFTGIGWDEVNTTIDAPASWWEQRIEENPKFRKFRGKDLSLYWFAYDDLFGDIVATGRARAPFQRDPENDASMADAVFTGLSGEEEGKGDIDDAISSTSNDLFPTLSLGESKTCSGAKKRKSGAEYVHGSLDNVVHAISSKSNAATGAQAAEDAKLEEAIGILDNMTCLEGMTDFYHFAQTYILDRGQRTLFLKSRNDDYRLSLLKYNYDRCNRGGL